MSEPAKGASVVVVGAGIVGASVGYHLMARGCRDVVILEREESPASQSTARSAAGVRHQFGTEVNIRLSLYSIERLARFTEEVGGHAELRQVGYLLLHSDPATWATALPQVELQRRLGVPTETLTPAEAERVVPGTRTGDLVGATFCRLDGYCDPYGIAMGYLEAARRLGAIVRTSSPAIAIEREGGRVVAIQTPEGRIACDWVVNAAGAWAGAVGRLAGLEIPVLPYRRSIYMTEELASLPGEIPLTIDMSSGFYMRKEGPGLLFGLSNEAEPSSERTDVDWDWLDTVLEAGVNRFPMLADARLASKQCWAGLYEITPDHLPVLGRHPELPNYVDASGFSGHGVMHSPATGMLMAEEILDGRARTIDIDPLRIGRFAESGRSIETNIF